MRTERRFRRRSRSLVASAIRESISAVSLSRYVEISCCVLRGGFDSFVRPNAEREILCLVDPETLDSTSFRKGIELIAHITKRLSQSALGLRIATSTTVTTEYPKLSGDRKSTPVTFRSRI